MTALRLKNVALMCCHMVREDEVEVLPVAVACRFYLGSQRVGGGEVGGGGGGWGWGSAK